MRRTAALIVGGGPAGASTAIALARAGARPLLLERSRAPRDVVCGGFLGWDALERLARLGVDAWALGAHRIDRVRIVTGGRTVEAPLPGPAAGLSRRVLDEALLDRAAAAGAEVKRGVAVRQLAGDIAHLPDGEAIAADALFVATGKHELRGNGARRAGGHVGLGFRVAGDPALAHTIELHPFRGGYAGLLLLENGQANLCLSIAPARLAAAGGAAPAALARALAREAPALSARLARVSGGGTAIAGVPYGWRRREGARAFRLGDQAAVIASVAGDGVSLALASGAAAAEAWAAGADGRAFQPAFAARVRRPLAWAEACRRAAEAPAVARTLLPFAARIGLIERLAAWTRVG